MRNLKRVLSLALATVMLLGMMVVGAGAADAKKTALTDLDKVVNKEAVNLMIDLGIIVGKPDGTFDPAGAVDRATMAKLITYIMMGDVSADLFEGTATDLKDIDKSWAKGYIKYCYANKIIAGDGKGSFFPTNGVTVAEASKMLLVAIGYDAKAQGYEGDSWSINVMRDAKIAGLLKNIDAKTNDALTRDTAAQMIFNALMTKTITYKTQYDGGVAHKTDPTSVGNSTLGQLQYNLAKAEGPVNDISDEGTANLGVVVDAAGVTVDGAVSTAMGKLPASVDMVGGKVVAYYNTVTKKLISTALSVSPINVIGTLTSGIADSTAYTKLTTRGDKTFVAQTETSPLFFLNGKTVSNANLVKAGAVVEFIDQNGNNKAEVVRITEKKVATLTAAPVLGTNSTGDAVVTIGALGISKVLATKVIGYEGLAKDDVVLYVQLGNTTYIEKAATLEGIVTGTSVKGKLIDGTNHKDSGLDGANLTGWTSGDFKNTYTFYLDNGKNIVKATKVTDKDTAANYAVLSDIAWVSGSGIGASNYVEAKLIFVDGTTEVVKIASINGVKAVSDSATLDASTTHLFSCAGTTVTENSTATTDVAVKTYYYTNPSSTDVVAKYFGVSGTDDLTSIIGLNVMSNKTTGSTATAPAFAQKNTFYEFTKNTDGQYLLKNTGLANSVTLADQAAKITTNTALFDTANVANANTVFVFANKDSNEKVTYTVYTGIANVPTTTAISSVVKNTIVKNASGVAMYVFVSGVVTTTASKDFVYITSADEMTSAVNGVSCWVNAALLNGVKAEGGIKLNSADYAVGLYTVASIDANGIYALTGASANVGLTLSTGIKSISAGTVQFNSNFTPTGGSAKSVFTYSADSVAYYIDKDGNCTETTVDAIALSTSNKFYLTTRSTTSDEIVVLYVVEAVAPAHDSATVVAGSATPVTTIGEASLMAAGGATITAWTAASADLFKVSIDPAAGYSVKSITVGNKTEAFTTGDGVAATTTDCKLTANGPITVTVGVQDNISKNIEVYTYTITASGKGA